MSLRKKRIIAVILIIIGLPLAIASATGGGGIGAYFFAAVLAFGVDMLTEKDKIIN